MSQDKLTVELTHKSKETEETFDVLFYRPLGYIIALGSRKLGITPNGITIFSIFVGVAAGHLFYYNDLIVNIIGIGLLIFAEALDSADGQLARMTNTKSRFGRILDGFGENLWFVSIYLHFCLRLMNDGYSYSILFFAVICGISHSLQGAMADRYRNYYLYFVYGRDKSEVDGSEQLQKEYAGYSWSNNPVKKFLLRIYINYTVEQEFLSSKSIKLYNQVFLKYRDAVPVFVSQEFRNKNKRLIKYCNIITTNTRMAVMFAAVLINYIPLYFIFEATVLNLLLIYVIYKHEKNSREIYNNVLHIQAG